jgi:sialidase-1
MWHLFRLFLCCAQGGLKEVAKAASVVDISTLWPYHKRSSGNINAGSGNWWGASFAVTRHGTVLAGGELKLETTQHNVPTQLELRRSEDGGITWSHSIALVSDPENATVFGGGGFIYSHLSDTVFFLYLGEAHKGQPEPMTELPVYVIASKDDGLTWSQPVRAAKDSIKVTGGEILGHGLELKHGPRAGRLIIAANEQVGTGPSSGPGYDLRAYSTYSDDGGLTWQQGSDLPVPFTPIEATLAELDNGSLVISVRNALPRTAGNLCEDGEVCHTFGRSDDGGQSWVQTWSVSAQQLPVHTCQSSLVAAADGKTLFLGAPMNTTTGDRYNYTVYTSKDGGRQWQWFVGVFQGASGYGDMTFLPNGQLGIAFQRGLGLKGIVGGGYEMAYARVDMSDSHVVARDAIVL